MHTYWSACIHLCMYVHLIHYPRLNPQNRCVYMYAYKTSCIRFHWQLYTYLTYMDTYIHTKPHEVSSAIANIHIHTHIHTSIHVCRMNLNIIITGNHFQFLPGNRTGKGFIHGHDIRKPLTEARACIPQTPVITRIISRIDDLVAFIDIVIIITLTVIWAHILTVILTRIWIIAIITVMIIILAHILAHVITIIVAALIHTLTY
jgi:hypothetical protein